jgi:FkbM family methyltransferase
MSKQLAYAVRRLGAGLLDKIGLSSPRSSNTATERDLYYCYRLLLKREPDREGWRYWSDKIADRHVTIDTLTAGFVDSAEFLQAHSNATLSRAVSAPHRVQMVELDDYKLYFSPADYLVGGFIAQWGFYERNVVRELRALLKPGDVFLDIGANIGYFSLLAASLVGETGKVIAFEPNPENCALLWLSMLENGYTNIELHPYAADEQEKLFMLEVEGSNGRLIPENLNDGFVTFAGDAGGPLPGRLSFPVRSVALDTALAAVDRIDVIKIDVEGAEPRAMRGMHNTIQKHRPVILTEFSVNMIPVTSRVGPETYLDLLHELDYDLYAVEEETTRPLPQRYEQVIERYFSTGLDHIDLVAYPKRS